MRGDSRGKMPTGRTPHDAHLRVVAKTIGMSTGILERLGYVSIRDTGISLRETVQKHERRLTVTTHPRGNITPLMTFGKETVTATRQNDRGKTCGVRLCGKHEQLRPTGQVDGLICDGVLSQLCRWLPRRGIGRASYERQGKGKCGKKMFHGVYSFRVRILFQ